MRASVPAPSRHARRLPALTLGHVWALGALAVTLLTCQRGYISLSDFWWHLRTGQIIAATGQIPTVDAYSFTALGHYYPYHEWLGELYLYAVYRLGGIELNLFVNAVLLTAATGVVLALAWRQSRDLRLASLCTMLAMFVALANRDVRPQVWGILFFALTHWLLSGYRLRPTRAIWLLPLLAVLWVNTHGSVVMGVVAALAVACCEVVKVALRGGVWTPMGRRDAGRLSLAAGLMLPALLLNPWGAGFLQFGLDVATNPVNQALVAEWQAPTFRNPQSVPFFLLLLAGAAAFALSRRACDPVDVVLWLGFAVAALASGRNTVWFALVAAPLLAGQLGALLDQWRPQSRQAAPTGAGAPTGMRLAANYTLAGLLLGAVVLTTPWLKPALPLPADWRALVEPTTPVAAVPWVKANLAGERLFHPDQYGTYLIWAGQPVFVDGRTELYPLAVWQDYLLISRADDWETRLAHYQVRHALLAKDQNGGLQASLLSALSRSPDWRVAYEDATAVVFARR
ncbi:MAG: hypothetical protein ACYC4L_17920 [Chloroflexota bacterium]